MIRISRTGVEVRAEAIVALRREFQDRHLIRLPQLLSSSLLEPLERQLESGIWLPRSRGGMYSTVQLEPGPAVSLLCFVCNWPGFLEVVHHITGLGPFTWFDGYVYRMSPGAGHHDSWHSDDTDGRLVAMSVNLSPRGFRGGLLQMRSHESSELLVEVANTGFGDATLFRISPHLVHRVTEVEAGDPRTAFAGWFHSTKPRFLSRLQQGSTS